ncbi:hypothetical protein A7K95_03780 [Pediococcus parvulus]|uniref:DUF4097 family beta strand repeat protein n=1 Tax=Pediococcus parvulus TaxID=54062 RepID=A0AAP5TDC5_9LACO|nr:DUF4097 family beta strand repeat-containing protein [Pediococcus parvulus]MDV7695237.1 DUF4097 family beta strand repeat protein [Pediococcus parvulus]OAD64605.1 hypothetical protein A7K95_03780 [Pediococcus parvulus]
MTNIETKVRTKLDQLFMNYTPSTELTELKEELVSDLTEATNDNVADGMDEDKAIQTAFDRLGNLDELVQEITNEHNADEDEGHSHEGHNRNSVHIGNLDIEDGKVRLGNQTLADGDKVEIGKLLKVDGDNVDIGDGFIKVTDGDVTINGKTPSKVYMESLPLVNSQAFPIQDLTNIAINYKSASLTIKQTDGDQLIVNEYMSRNNDRYYLRSNVTDHELTIRQGDQPLLWHLNIKVEILVPSTYTKTLNADTKDGRIRVQDLKNEQLNLNVVSHSGSTRAETVKVSQLNMEAFSGSIHGENIQATKLTSHSHSGSVSFDSVNSLMNLKSNSGSIRVTHGNGSGNFRTHSGSVKLNFDHLNGDVAANTHSGSVKLTLPNSETFNFELETKSGRAKVDGNVVVEHSGNSYQTGHVGEHPQYKVTGNTNSGSAKLNLED